MRKTYLKFVLAIFAVLLVMVMGTATGAPTGTEQQAAITGTLHVNPAASIATNNTLKHDEKGRITTATTLATSSLGAGRNNPMVYAKYDAARQSIATADNNANFEYALYDRPAYWMTVSGHNYQVVYALNTATATLLRL